MADPASSRVPSWYRRAVVVALLVLVVAPAVWGALWFAPGALARPPLTGPGASPSGGGRTSTGDEGSPGAVDGGPDASALRALLDARAKAVGAGDASAWVATVDPSVPGLRGRQQAVFDRIRQVRPTSWRYEVLPPDATLPQDRREVIGVPAFLAHVALDYRVAPGTPEVRRDQHVTVAWRGRWLVAGTDDGVQQRDVWDLGPVDVRRGARSVVVAAASGAVPGARTAAEADAASARVDAVWGANWPRTSLVQVPANLADMAALLGRSGTDGLSQLAAVTTGQRRTTGAVAPAAPHPSASATAQTGDTLADPAMGDLVVLNPTAFSGLTPTGRTAVLTHELTHVATRASVRTSPPVWVDEGFADYVAYLDTPLTARDVAADVLDSPSRLAALTDLPDDSAFDPSAGDVGPAYAQAWLAMRYVDREGGTPMVVDFYRVAAGLSPLRHWPAPAPVRPSLAPRTPLEHACYDVVGYLEPSFVRRWVAYVRSLA